MHGGTVLFDQMGAQTARAFTLFRPAAWETAADRQPAAVLCMASTIGQTKSGATQTLLRLQIHLKPENGPKSSENAGLFV